MGKNDNIWRCAFVHHKNASLSGFISVLQIVQSFVPAIWDWNTIGIWRHQLNILCRKPGYRGACKSWPLCECHGGCSQHASCDTDEETWHQGAEGEIPTSNGYRHGMEHLLWYHFRWTFYFVYFVGRAIHEDPNEIVIHLSYIAYNLKSSQVSTEMSNVDKPQN